MLLNTNTLDSCFISSSWQITSRGMFAGSCIGVLLLCIAIEAVRRLGRAYDRRLVKQAKVVLLSSIDGTRPVVIMPLHG